MKWSKMFHEGPNEEAKIKKKEQETIIKDTQLYSSTFSKKDSAEKKNSRKRPPKPLPQAQSDDYSDDFYNEEDKDLVKPAPKQKLHPFEL